MIAKALLVLLLVAVAAAGFFAFKWKDTEAAFEAHIARSNAATIEQVEKALAVADRENAMRAAQERAEHRRVVAEVERALADGQTDQPDDCDKPMRACSVRVIHGLYGRQGNQVREATDSGKPTPLQ